MPPLFERKTAINSLKLLAAIILLEITFFRFVISPIEIDGESMLPSFEEGKTLYLNKLAYVFSEPKRGDIVVIRDFDGELIIKRIVALPHETLEIKEDKIFINDKVLEEPYLKNGRWIGWFLSKQKVLSNNYYCVGDNRLFSQAIFEHGFFEKKEIIGKIIKK